MRLVVVADDFTGGNAVAGLLTSAGFRCLNVLAQRREDAKRLLASPFDAMIVTAETRHMPPAEAQKSVAAIIRSGLPADLVVNRIDSTLRGNISATTKGALEAVRGAAERRTVALCVPAHPAGGRQTVGGYQLLEGVRLEETEAANDPMFPITSSVVASALTRTADLVVSSIALDQVTGPADTLADALVCRAAASDVIVVDAFTEAHLRRIATAAAATHDVLWVAVDPGPFTRELASALGSHGQQCRPILAIFGSTSDLSRRQLHHLVETQPTSVIDGQELAAGPVELLERTVVDRVVDALLAPGSNTVVLATAMDKGKSVAGDCDGFADRLGRTVRAVLERAVVGGLYLTGGDVASAVLANLDAAGLTVQGEVIPLAVVGSIIGGPWDGTNVVTKGGMVGDGDAAVRCIMHLLDAVEGAQPGHFDDYSQITRS